MKTYVISVFLLAVVLAAANQEAPKKADPVKAAPVTDPSKAKAEAPPTPTGEELAEYWEMMAQIQATNASVETAENAALKARDKAREAADKNLQVIQQRYAALMKKMTDRGCRAEQVKEGGLRCLPIEDNKKKP